MLLLIEDSDDNYYAFRRALKQVMPELPLRRCADAHEARAMLHELARDLDGFGDELATPAGAHADNAPLVFLDLNMPGMDGRALLQEIRGMDALRGTRIIVYSTSDSPADISFCYRNGANAYHTKPLDFDDMRAELEAIVGYWVDLAQQPGAPASMTDGRARG